MNLIVDNGGTKATWTISKGNEVLKQFTTPGIYPFHVNDDGFIEYIQRAKQEITHPIHHIYFYSTGCSLLSQRQRIARLFEFVYATALSVEVDTDLLAAARALCGHYPGIACIMGTGSNSCSYDGVKVTRNLGGFGFILGDEGSGAVMGKRLIQSYLGGLLPNELKKKFESEYPIDKADILQNVYQKPQANKYLASFAPFLHRHKSHPFFESIILTQFGSFIQKYVMAYDQYERLPLHFIGSISIYFGDELRRAATGYGVQVHSCVQSPMEGLVKYHSIRYSGGVGQRNLFRSI